MHLRKYTHHKRTCSDEGLLDAHIRTAASRAHLICVERTATIRVEALKEGVDLLDVHPGAQQLAYVLPKLHLRNGSVATESPQAKGSAMSTRVCEFARNVR